MLLNLKAIPEIFKEELAKFTKNHLNIAQNGPNATHIKSLKSYEKTLYNERNNKGYLFVYIFILVFNLFSINNYSDYLKAISNN